MRFSLSKWYADVVTDDGRVAIAYWAEVRAGGVRHAVSGSLRACPGESVRAFSLRDAVEPSVVGDRLSWHAALLGLDVVALRLAPPVSHRLVETPEGAVDWHAFAPAARVRIALGDEVLEGAGYAERLDVTLAPWAVPVRTFRWGRWMAGACSLVWIAWDGPHPLALAWLDGAPVATPRISDEDVGLGSAGRLAITDRTVITDATVGEQLTSLAPLRALVDRVASSHQYRWRSRGTLTLPGAPPVAGWTIHEVVRWR